MVKWYWESAPQTLAVPFKRWLIQPQWARPGGFIRAVGWEEPKLEPRTGRRVHGPPFTALGTPSGSAP